MELSVSERSKPLTSLIVCSTLVLAIMSQSSIVSPKFMLPDTSINSIPQAFGQQPNDYLTYENPTHGIQIQYPSDWERYDGAEQGDIVQFLSPFEDDADNYSENFGIFFDSLPSGMTLEEYASAVIDTYTKVLDSFEPIGKSTSVTLAGHPAFELVFTSKLEGDLGDSDLQSRHTLIIKDGRGYVFYFNSEESRYPLYLPLIDDILASLSLKRSSSVIIDEQPDFVSYESSTHGIKIEYPSDWEKVEDTAERDLIVKFVSPARNQFDFREEFQIFFERIPSVWSLEDYVKVSTNVLVSDQTMETDIIESSTINIGGKQAYKVLYSASVNGTDAEFKGIVFFTLNRGTAFTFSFITFSDLYPEFLPIIEEMMDSFAFTRMQDLPVEPTQYLTYANRTYSIQAVKYPDNWILSVPEEANATGVYFFSQNYETAVSVGYFDLVLPQVQLSEYVDFRIKELRERVTLFNLIETNLTTLAGEPAQVIVYKGHMQLIGDKLFPYKLMEIMSLRDGRAYVITYGTFEDRYSTYLPIVENMVDSFQMDRTLAPKVLNGTYSNFDLGLEMTLPEKWAGIQREKTGVTEVILSAEDASLDSDYSSMFIVSGSDDDLQSYFAENYDPSVTCDNDRTFEIVNLAGAKAFRGETTCDDPDLPKYYTYFVKTEEKSVYMFYDAPSDSVYAANLPKFHESVGSLKILSTVDLSDVGEYAKYSGLEEEEYTVTAKGEDYELKVATNSSITRFEFDEEEKRLSISLDGKDGTEGETYLDIGTILEGDYIVRIDGEVIEDNDDSVMIIDDQTTNKTFISIVYTHSEPDITIIGTNVVPEFPGSAVFIAALVALAVALISFSSQRSSKSKMWSARA